MIIRLLVTLLCFSVSCSSLHSLKKDPSDKQLFQHALKLKKKSYYKDSLSYFKKLKNYFLYSPLVKEADLHIAHIYFAQEEWKKASIAYKNFLTLYPNHPKNDSVLFYLALSYFKQLPSTQDRDLKFSARSLLYLNKHLTNFPKSPLKSKTLKYKQKVLILLAKKEWMIAYFHLKHKRPLSALPYIKKLIKNYSFVLPIKTNTKVAFNASLPSLKSLKKAVQKIKKI